LEVENGSFTPLVVEEWERVRHRLFQRIIEKR